MNTVPWRPPETRPPENREWIDFAKGVAIILVVLYHASLFLDTIDLAGSTTRVRSFLAFVPMPVFFFVAGLTGRRMLTWSFPDLWRRRLLVLVYLYLLWSLLRVLFYLVVPHLRGSETAPTDLLNLALLPVRPSSSYWFIWALAIFTLVAWLLRKVPPVVQVTGAALLAVAATTPGLLDLDNVGWDRVCQNLFFFLLAIFIPRFTYRLAARVRVWHVLALAVVYGAIALAIVYLNAARIPGVGLFESVVAVAGVIAASVLLARVRWLGFVNVLGRASFQIYLLHLFIVAIALWLLTPVADSSVLQSIANLLPIALGIVALVAPLYIFKSLRGVTWLWVSPFSTGRAAKRRAKRTIEKKRSGERLGAPPRVDTPREGGAPASPPSPPTARPSDEARPRNSVPTKPSTLDGR